MRLGLCALLLATCLVAAAADDTLDDAFERDVLAIVASKHACYRFDIYLAVTYEQQKRGLMFVRELPETTGMLFIYPKTDYYSMWMKNTFIPLDIAFATENGTIVNIARHTEPQSLKSISSERPVNYVLELNAGVTERLKIHAGSRLIIGPGIEQIRTRQ
ncbi:MAG: DUF192 domain-containing protein [Woeseiaceae bacterium]|nr:DUF192 domain-containing protein [Woeseiaceae bacterium]